MVAIAPVSAMPARTGGHTDSHRLKSKAASERNFHGSSPAAWLASLCAGFLTSPSLPVASRVIANYWRSAEREPPFEPLFPVAVLENSNDLRVLVRQ
jgi:hypothetical protein